MTQLHFSAFCQMVSMLPGVGDDKRVLKIQGDYLRSKT